MKRWSITAKRRAPESPAAPEDRLQGYVVAACLAVFLLIGGAGAAYPLLEALVELLALGLLGFALAGSRFAVVRRITATELVLIGLIIAIPLLQMLSIPVDRWAALPGRSLPADILLASDLHPALMPLTLTREQTMRAMLALAPGLAMFVAGRRLSDANRRFVIGVILALAAFSACLGALQLVIGATPQAPAYASRQAGQALGLFVNRNHQAAFLLVAICLTASMPRRQGSRSGSWPLGLMILFAAGALATTSRASLILLPLCALPVVARLLRGRSGPVLTAVALLALSAAAWHQGALPRLLARFADGPEQRLTFWHTTLEAARAYWPVGSGIGTFKLVYPLFESRNELTPFFVNHAHNDYLELLLEGGVAAAVAILLFLLWYARRGWELVRAEGGGIVMAGGAWGGIAVLLAYSLVDYPLRALSIMALFGFLCSLMDHTKPQTREAPLTPLTSRLWMAGIGVTVVAAAVLALRDGMAQRALSQGRPQRAAVLQPLSSAALTSIAAADLAAGNHAAAAERSMSAVALSPTNQQVLATLSLARRSQGRFGESDRLSVLAGDLGWRGLPAQLWLMMNHGERGRAGEAVERADALLRQGFDVPAISLMRMGAGEPRFAAALADVLAGDPPWRERYLTKLRDLSAQTATMHERLLHEMAARGTRPTAGEAGALVLRAAALEDHALAARSWSELGPARTHNLLPDPNYARIDVDAAARAGVFGWRRTEVAELTIEPPDPNVASRAQGPTFVLNRSAVGVFLYQDLFLKPGSYRVTTDISAKAPLDGEVLSWTVSCTPSGARADEGQRWKAIDRGRGRMSLSFAVKAGSCRSQRLALHGAGVGIGTLELALSDTMLTPIMEPIPTVLPRAANP